MKLIMENWRKYVKEQEDQSQANLTEGVRDFAAGSATMTLLDDVIKKFAPEMIRRILEQEINQDMEAFTTGALEGRFEKQRDFASEDPSPATYKYPEKSLNFRMGYSWGWENADKWTSNELPEEDRKRAMDDQIEKYERRMTEEMFELTGKHLLQIAKNFNFALFLFQAVDKVIRKFDRSGLRAGTKALAYSLVGGIAEILDDVILVYIMVKNGLPPVTTTFGISDIIRPYILRKVGGDDDESRKYQEELADELGWYEEKFGDVPSLGNKKKAKE